ncbi:MAG: alpha/beta hydrolase [Dolichospermum sp.]
MTGATTRGQVTGDREERTITHYLLPITHYQLPITHYPLPITSLITTEQKLLLLLLYQRQR